MFFLEHSVVWVYGVSVCPVMDFLAVEQLISMTFA